MVEQEYKTSLKSGDPTDDDIQLKEQFPAGDEFAPKVRKPYTITKQRERWTEDEHTNFLEALKLYGRAWRRIEDHVGTKTAVQIRSHAQKFFSKVVRDSNIGDSTKPIEIPPPRPKKKPVHPYPRKLVSPVKTSIWIPEKRAMLICPNTFEQENRSPKSILSAVRSDSSGGADSCMPIGSPSSVSSALALNTAKSFGSEVCKLSSEDVFCSRLDHEDEKLSSDEEMPPALDLSCQNMEFVKGDTNESATQSLKLFGKTLFVENPYEKSCSFPVRVMPLKLPTSNILYTQITIENSKPTDAFPWLSLCSNESDSSPVVPSPTQIKAQSLYAKKEKSDNDEQNDGSSTGSNADLVNDSFPIPFAIPIPFERKGGEEKSFSSYKLSKRISSESLKNRSGFVPYKRCFAEQDCTIYSRETDCR